MINSENREEDTQDFLRLVVLLAEKYSLTIKRMGQE